MLNFAKEYLKMSEKVKNREKEKIQKLKSLSQQKSEDFCNNDLADAINAMAQTGKLEKQEWVKTDFIFILYSEDLVFLTYKNHQNQRKIIDDTLFSMAYIKEYCESFEIEVTFYPVITQIAGEAFNPHNSYRLCFRLI